MNKSELIAKIADVAGLSKADAKKALDATVDVLKEALVAGEKIQLVGFGTFAVAERPAREGINPATKEKIQILHFYYQIFPTRNENVTNHEYRKKRQIGVFLIILNDLFLEILILL